MPLTKLAINNHDSLIIGITLFFLIYSYHVKLIQIELVYYIDNRRISLIEKGELIIQKLAQAREWA